MKTIKKYTLSAIIILVNLGQAHAYRDSYDGRAGDPVIAQLFETRQALVRQIERIDHTLRLSDNERFEVILSNYSLYYQGASSLFVNGILKGPSTVENLRVILLKKSEVIDEARLTYNENNSVSFLFPLIQPHRVGRINLEEGLTIRVISNSRNQQDFKITCSAKPSCTP